MFLYSHQACAELLLSWNAKVDYCDSSKGTPLTLAAQHGHVGIVRLLIGHNSNNNNNKCDVNQHTYPLRATAMHYAASHGHKVSRDVIGLLVELREGKEGLCVL